MITISITAECIRRFHMANPNIFAIWEGREARMDKVKDARRRARNRAQKPGAVQVIPDKRRKPVKHKKPLHDVD